VIEKEIDARIADHRETVETLRKQFGAAQHDTEEERQRLDQAVARVAHVLSGLEGIAFGN
jgi:hypothetical protein